LQESLIHRKIGESKSTVEWDLNLPLNLTIFQTVVVIDIMHCRTCIFVTWIVIPGTQAIIWWRE